MGLLNIFSIGPMGPSNGIDQHSPALVWAHSKVSVPDKQAVLIALTIAHHIVVGPVDSLATESMGLPNGIN